MQVTRTTINVDSDIWEKLETIANAQSVSRNKIINELLEEYVANYYERAQEIEALKQELAAKQAELKGGAIK